VPRLGILGTMVWDTIHSRDVGREAPVEEWGGIAYALAAADAALDEGWSIFPIVKVGRDLRARANAFFATLPRVEGLDGVRTVPEPNNRVQLFYQRSERRCEKLTGGVPGWTAEELLPLARSCDALYVNFIAGWELDLPASVTLGAAYEGPLYCDVHSLLLGVGPDGVRVLRPLDDWRSWLTCFDVVQLNEDELGMLAGGRDDPWAIVAETLGDRPGALVVTLGERGAAWVTTRAFLDDPVPTRRRAQGLRGPVGPLLSGKVEAETKVDDPDPTGCGDVWGATCFSALLGGARLEEAMRRANVAAGRNAGYRGAGGLNEHLRSPTGLVTGGADERKGRATR